MKKILFDKLKRIAAVAVSAAVVFSATPQVFAETANPESINYEYCRSIADSSAVLVKGSPFYTKGGTKQYYDSANKDYSPQYDDADIYVPADCAKRILDYGIEYDTSNDTFTITKGNKVLKVRRGEDALYIDGVGRYNSSIIKKTDRMYLFPLKTIAESLGIGVIERDDVMMFTEDNGVADYFNAEDKQNDKITLTGIAAEDFYEPIFEDGFEQKGTWAFYDWAGTSRAWKGNGLTESEHHTGKQAAYINAIPTSFAGYQTPVISYDKPARSYRVTFWAKTSDDFSGNTVSPSIMLYNGARFTRQLGMTQIGNESLGKEWKRFEYIIHSKKFFEDNVSSVNSFDIHYMFDSFRLLMSVSPESGQSDVSGTVYVDDVKLSAIENYDTNVQLYAQADKFASWYEPGDTVTYTFSEPSQLDGYESLIADVYDIDGNVINSKKIDISAAKKRGYSYTPERSGYFEVAFRLVSTDGTVRDASDGYTYAVGKNIYSAVLKRHSFAVTEKSKPMEERNDMFYLSDGATDIKNMQLADLVGYSGIRIHTVNWGRLAGGKGFNNEQGVYDWSEPDSQIGNIKEVGFKNIIPNIVYMPKWAVAPENRIQAGTNIVGAYNYNIHAPENMSYVKDAISEFTKRYKDDIKGIEFWNEPYYGKTAFWEDGPDAFREMSCAAYDAMKEVDENLEFISAGFFASAPAFVDELMSKGDYKDKLDVFSYHGRYEYLRGFKQVLEKHNLLGKVKLMDSEGYYYNELDSVNGVKDMSVNNMVYLMCVMSAVKNDVDYITHFCITDGTNVTEYSKVKGYNYYGLFSKYPHYEPHPGAVVAHTFMNEVGKEFEFNAEYDFGDGQKAVSFTNDGEPFVVIWNANDKEFSLSDELRNTYTQDTELIDFEGNKADADNLKPKKVYFLKGISDEKLAKINSTEDTALNFDYMSPYYTCKKETVEAIKDVDFSTMTTMENELVKPFDENTFEITSDTNWISDGWKWVANGTNDKPGEFAAKHTAYIDKNGLYVMIDVTDSSFYNEMQAANPDQLWNFDSVQIGLDTVGRNKNSDRIELQIGLAPTGVTLYKGNAPEIHAMLPTGYTSAGKVMPSKYANITQTDHGMLYKIFIPTSELFPYEYPGTADYTRISLLVNDNNGDGRIGYLEWGSGIGGDKSVAMYGAIKHLKEEEQNN